MSKRSILAMEWLILVEKSRFSNLENLKKNHYENGRINPFLWKIDPWRNIVQRFFFFHGSILIEKRINPYGSSSKNLSYLHQWINPCGSGKECHWKRNFKVFLDTLKENKPKEASTLGMFMIEMNLSTFSTSE